MKFMYDYCTTFFDTRHLVIAVILGNIEMYEALLFPAAHGKRGGELRFRQRCAGGGRHPRSQGRAGSLPQGLRQPPVRRDLHAYFMVNKLANIQWPHRRFYTTNDPVPDPRTTRLFFQSADPVRLLSDRKKALMHSIYDLPEYRAVLPNAPLREEGHDIRRHQRFSVRCPGRISFTADDGQVSKVGLEVVQVSNTASRPAPRTTFHWKCGARQPSIWAATKLRSSKPWP